MKHGYYSRRFKMLEVDDLDTILTTGLQNEIALLRVVIRRVFEHVDHLEDATADDWMTTLEVLSRAASRLAGILRTQHLLGKGEDSELASTISRVINEVAQEYGFQ
jgi:hypothetical protein